MLLSSNCLKKPFFLHISGALGHYIFVSCIYEIALPIVPPKFLASLSYPTNKGYFLLRFLRKQNKYFSTKITLNTLIHVLVPVFPLGQYTNCNKSLFKQFFNIKNSRYPNFIYFIFYSNYFPDNLTFLSKLRSKCCSKVFLDTYPFVRLYFSHTSFTRVALW